MSYMSYMYWALEQIPKNLVHKIPETKGKKRFFGDCHGYKPVSKIYDIGSSIQFCFSGFLLSGPSEVLAHLSCLPWQTKLSFSVLCQRIQSWVGCAVQWKIYAFFAFRRNLLTVSAVRTCWYRRGKLSQSLLIQDFAAFGKVVCPRSRLISGNESGFKLRL